MKIKAFVCLVIVFILEHSFAQNWNDVADRCFCKLQGEIDDCSCKVETLDSFNNNKIYPRLKSLLTKNYFRYFKVNLKKGCPFWSADSKCTVRDCHVELCPKNEVPIKLEDESDNEAHVNKYTKESNEVNGNVEESCAVERELSALDTTISDDKKSDFQSWQQYDEALPMFCETDDESSSDLDYVDLLLNPERYTGYKGPSAHRIWKSIYEENCFKPGNSNNFGKDSPKSYGTEASMNSSMCLEKRVFYHLISGLHTSINVHLSDNYRFSAKSGFGSSKWDHNLKEFLIRFDPELTNGQGPERLKNLYFAYLIELRALAKAKPYFTQESFYTGDPTEDSDLKEGVLSLLDVIQSFPNHFNESELFIGNTKEKKQLKAEFVQHFQNISRIMDCVECDKCRLWGKLQILGMGTALKILFSRDVARTGTSIKNFHLTRAEIVALFNAFGRLSSSVYAIETFRRLAEESRAV